MKTRPPDFHDSSVLEHLCELLADKLAVRISMSGAEGTRTPDPLRAKQAAWGVCQAAL